MLPKNKTQNLITRFLFKAYNRLEVNYQKFASWFWLESLKFHAKRLGVNVTLGKAIQVNRKTIIQGKGQIKLGDGVLLGYRIGGSPTLPILIQPRYKNSSVEIGDHSALVNGTEIIACEKIVIGKNCRIGAKCTIIDSDFHGIHPEKRSEKGKISPVTIGNNVWIGLGAIVLKGVLVGDDAIIGAGCVVSKNVNPGDIVAGNPMLIVGNVYDNQFTE